jgi:hypothetical protein
MKYLKLFENIENYILYHGSKYYFTKFDLNKIGTGQTSQDFGYGFYFSNKIEVAEYYSNILANIERNGNKVYRYGYLYKVSVYGNIINYNSFLDDKYLSKINIKLNVRLKNKIFANLYKEVSIILGSDNLASILFTEIGIDGVWLSISSKKLSKNLNFEDEKIFVIYNEDILNITDSYKKEYSGLLNIFNI